MSWRIITGCSWAVPRRCHFSSRSFKKNHFDLVRSVLIQWLAADPENILVYSRIFSETEAPIDRQAEKGTMLRPYFSQANPKASTNVARADALKINVAELEPKTEKMSDSEKDVRSKKPRSDSGGIAMSIARISSGIFSRLIARNNAFGISHFSSNKWPFTQRWR